MRFACFVLVLIACAGTASAQAPAAPKTPPASAPGASPAAAPPASPAPAAAPSAPGTPAAEPTAVPAAPAPDGAQPAPAAQGDVPPPPPQYPTPQSEPAAPTPPYQPLGGKPEPEIEKGDWDPWEHVGDAKHRHDGFMLRMSIGLGFGGTGGDNHVLTGEEVALAGLGLNYAIGIGGALTENLVLNADIFHSTIYDPEIQIDGEDAGRTSDLREDLGVGEDFELAGIGIGVTYYLMPANVYLAGSLGIGRVIFVDGSGDRGGSDVGFAANLMIGKEWWVGLDWGIGVAGQLIVIAAEDEILGDVGGIGFGVLFSATYN